MRHHPVTFSTVSPSGFIPASRQILIAQMLPTLNIQVAKYQFG
jgi:hypothetical protein